MCFEGQEMSRDRSVKMKPLWLWWKNAVCLQSFQKGGGEKKKKLFIFFLKQELAVKEKQRFAVISP